MTTAIVQTRKRDVNMALPENSSMRKNEADVAIPENRTMRKNKAENTKHMKLLKQILGFIHNTGRIFSMQTNFQWTILKSFSFWHATGQVCLCWCMIIYNFFLHSFSGDTIRILEPIALSGITFACTQNMYMVPVHWHRLLSLILDFQRICRQNISNSRVEIIYEGLFNIVKVLKLYFVCVWSGLSIFALIPVKVYFVDHEWMSLLPLEVMFCDKSTISGFWVANFVSGELGLMSAFGTWIFGSMAIVAVLFYTVQIQLIREDFKDLDKMCTEKNNISLAYKRTFLKNIAKKRQDLNYYLDEIKTVYECQLTLYFFVNYLSLIVCLFEVIQRDWVPGYGLLAALLLQMIFYCSLGTIIASANEKYRNMIWETKWYLYDTESKNVVLMMLIECKDSQCIMIEPIGPLNIVTGITIIKSIYSYYTVMTELF